MKIIFVSIGMPNLSTQKGEMYADLLRELNNHNHSITVMAPSNGEQLSGLYQEGDFRVLRVKVGQFRGNIPFYKKGLRILQLSSKYKKAYKKHLSNEKFDVVMMATPPSTLVDVIDLIKRKSGAKCYLILRDIHPESLNRTIISKDIIERNDVYDECKKPFRVNPFVWRFLYVRSQKLYKIADWVGCMSPGNQDYLDRIAPSSTNRKNVVLPNWCKEVDLPSLDYELIKEKYGFGGKYVAIFGGVIGPAQGVWNIATLAKHYVDNPDIVFLIVGRGYKKALLEKWAKEENLKNMRFMEFMPKEDYEKILQMADVGLISIDEKFTVPTCPSKVIGYMSMAKPVIAMFNKGSDYGDYYIDRSGCGLWSVGLDNEKMFSNFEWMYTHPEERKAMGKSGYEYFLKNYTPKAVCDILCEQIEENNK